MIAKPNEKEVVNSYLVDCGYQVKCKCGTKTIMTDTDKTICRGCNHWIYRTKRAEFKNELKENLCKIKR